MIGENIKRLRTQNNMTQKDLAEKLFVSAQAVSRWEKGEVEPSLTTISDIASIFKVSTDELLDVQPAEPSKEEEPAQPTVVAAQPVLALCEDCNAPIYKQGDVCRENASVRSGRTSYSHETHIYCPACYLKRTEKKAENERLQKAENAASARRHRIWSYILGALAAGATFALLFTSEVELSPSELLTTSIVSAVLAFTFVSCLLLQNNFIGNMTFAIFKFGFVRFPGLIFTWDLDGILWVIGMKILFFLIGIALACLTGLLALLLGAAMSFFVYPFALVKSIRHPDDTND